MLTIAIEVSGISPLICNKFSDKAAEAATNGTRGASSAADRGTPLEIAAAKLYIGHDEEPMIPQPNLLRCLVDGGKFHKVGKSQLTTQTGSMLFACLFIEATEIPIEHRQPWKVDTRAVVIPATKGRILTHRPMFDDWRLAFEVQLDTSLCSAKLLRQVVDDAGSRIGLGDFRPSKKGPYGRFCVTSWKEQPVQLEEPQRIAAQ